MVSGGAPGPRPAEAPSFINIRLADELAASGRTSEHAQGAARAGSSFAKARLRLRLVTSQGSPYPSRSPRAHPSGWTRTQGLSHRDSHAPPSFGTTPVRMWNWPLAPLLRRESTFYS